MQLELITIRELLRDPQFRDYFTKVPTLPDHYTPDKLPWKLLVQKHGETRWRAKRFGTYRDAFDGFKKMLPLIDNAAINNPALSFMPPLRTVRVKGKTVMVRGKVKPVIKTIIWKPRLEADMANHNWCPYCRRPSIFKYASLPARRTPEGFVIPASEPAMRCCICGASENIVNLRAPEEHQNWDPNRPKVHQ